VRELRKRHRTPVTAAKMTIKIMAGKAMRVKAIPGCAWTAASGSFSTS